MRRTRYRIYRDIDAVIAEPDQMAQRIEDAHDRIETTPRNGGRRCIRATRVAPRAQRNCLRADEAEGHKESAVIACKAPSERKCSASRMSRHDAKHRRCERAQCATHAALADLHES